MTATARSVNTDPYQNHRFQITDSQGFIAGGFTFAGLPEVNFDVGEYREGLDTYPKKMPLRPHFQSFSLHTGVMLGDSSLFKWMRSLIEGKSYRTDVMIYEYHRTEVAGLTQYSGVVPVREWRCYNCLPIRFKPGGDKDSNSPDISIQEMDFDPEYFSLWLGGVEVTV